MRTEDRITTAITFVIVGPLVGASWMWFVSAASEIVRGAPNAIPIAWESLPVLIGIGYAAGLVPAFLTGFVFAALPVRWQRAVVALVIGAVVTWLLWELLAMFFRTSVTPASAYFVVIGAGALAASVSAWIARLILQARGHYYARDGGKG